MVSLVVLLLAQAVMTVEAIPIRPASRAHNVSDSRALLAPLPAESTNPSNIEVAQQRAFRPNARGLSMIERLGAQPPGMPIPGFHPREKVDAVKDWADGSWTDKLAQYVLLAMMAGYLLIHAVRGIFNKTYNHAQWDTHSLLIMEVYQKKKAIKVVVQSFEGRPNLFRLQRPQKRPSMRVDGKFSPALIVDWHGQAVLVEKTGERYPFPPRIKTSLINGAFLRYILRGGDYHATFFWEYNKQRYSIPMKSIVPLTNEPTRNGAKKGAKSEKKEKKLKSKDKNKRADDTAIDDGTTEQMSEQTSEQMSDRVSGETNEQQLRGGEITGVTSERTSDRPNGENTGVTIEQMHISEQPRSDEISAATSRQISEHLSNSQRGMSAVMSGNSTSGGNPIGSSTANAKKLASAPRAKDSKSGIGAALMGKLKWNPFGKKNSATKADQGEGRGTQPSGVMTSGFSAGSTAESDGGNEGDLPEEEEEGQEEEEQEEGEEEQDEEEEENQDDEGEDDDEEDD